jgi:hypothetical protein
MNLTLMLKQALDHTDTPQDLFMVVEGFQGLVVEATDLKVTFPGITLTPGKDGWEANTGPLNHLQIAQFINRGRHGE